MITVTLLIYSRRLADAIPASARYGAPDTLPSTAQVLRSIVEKIQDEIPLRVDGGIRRGTDVVKALALGAEAVLIGHPYLHGLAVAGADGVARSDGRSDAGRPSQFDIQNHSSVLQ